MGSPALFVSRTHPYVTHNVLGHGASNTTWTTLLTVLVPVLGIAAVGIVVYAFLRRGDASTEILGDGKPGD